MIIVISNLPDEGGTVSASRETLARTMGGRVEAASGGQVLLHLGALSLRMPGERLAEIAGMFHEAADCWRVRGGARRSQP